MKGIDMKTLLPSLGLAGLLMLSAGAASAGTVSVAFSHPGDYQDMPFSPVDREQVMKELSDHFERLGKRLPQGQELRIDVLDVDLAGRIYPNFRGRGDLRVLRGGADWPHMLVRYSLVSGGQVIATGEDQLSDMTYLGRINRYSDGDALRYEKRMIDDWFTQKFAPHKRG
jgi:hypothetical protein